MGVELLKERSPIMYRHSDHEIVKYHFQELYAEAERNRLIKQSGLWVERRKNRWDVRLLNGIGTWIVSWRCILQGQFAQNLFPGLSKLAAGHNPCLCVPEPCPD
jgi:hypothetical protein